MGGMGMAGQASTSETRCTWLGHGTFLLQTPGGRRLLLDAWVDHNPACPEAGKRLVAEGLDALLISHGHYDHIHDALDIARRTRARPVAIFETAAWLQSKGLQDVVGMNKGGTVEVAPGVSATMVRAEHSCGITDGDRIVYGGEAAGYVLTLEDGRRVYHAGDTALFGDMRLIGEFWRPEVAILPIGGLYTMDPEQAAYACGLLGVRAVVPGHYGTFPALRGTPQDLQKALAARGLRVEVLAPAPGESVAL
jgi:L-ascorbate metabolism protein UlaG (beta-lactamase superfamily)